MTIHFDLGVQGALIAAVWLLFMLVNLAVAIGGGFRDHGGDFHLLPPIGCIYAVLGLIPALLATVIIMVIF